MPAAGSSPGIIQSLEVCPVVCHEDTPLLRGEPELLFVGISSATFLMHGNGINSTLTKALSHPVAHVLIEQEAKRHTPWFALMRASISSGYVS